MVFYSKLFQLFHSSNKKIHISSFFREDHIDLQVGLYQLKTIPMITDVVRYIIIKPLQAESV